MESGSESRQACWLFVSRERIERKPKVWKFPLDGLLSDKFYVWITHASKSKLCYICSYNDVITVLHGNYANLLVAEFIVRALSMTFLTNQESKVQRASRWLGWALVLIHTLIAVSVASSFGKQGSEWWPVVFYAIDFPVSFPVILFFKHIHSFADWGTLAVFLVIGSAWHFYWPQFLVWGGRQLFIRLRPNEQLRSSP